MTLAANFNGDGITDSTCFHAGSWIDLSLWKPERGGHRLWRERAIPLKAEMLALLPRQNAPTHAGPLSAAKEEKSKPKPRVKYNHFPAQRIVKEGSSLW